MADAAEDVSRLDRIEGWPLPEERTEWFGDPAAERTLLDAYRTGRMHHAWLIGGQKGIGKATLAWRAARFILAHSDPLAPDVTDAASLAVPADHPVARRIARRAHPNLLALERAWREDRKRFLTELSVDEIRRTVSFFGSTSGEDGWRIAVVDSADDMSNSAANALLKVLEEPPARSLFFLVCHVPGRLLPTIRSRCRTLPLAPLPPGVVAQALAEGSAGALEQADIDAAAALSEGSLRRAILLSGEDGIDTYRAFVRLAATLPDLDIPAAHDFADRVSRPGADDAWLGFLDTVRAWLGRRVRGLDEPLAGGRAPPAAGRLPLARWAEVWEKVERSSADAAELNLDRKQVVLTILMTLAHASRM